MMRVILLAALLAVLLASCASEEAAPETDNIELPVPTQVIADVAPGNSSATANSIPFPTLVNDASGVSIYIYDFGSIILHAFVNPAEGFGTVTYIVEGDNSLVLIDSHYSAAAAFAFRAYVDSIDKPIDRIYVTHEHPDHINGLRDAFADVDSYAAAEAARLATRSGVTIDHVVDAGSIEIDGVAYEFEIYTGAESAESLVIKLPEYGIIAVGDLVYNGYHMVMNRSLTNWINLLGQLQTETTYELILPGHGAPGGVELYQNNLVYLEMAWRLYNEIDERGAFQEAMTEAYPDHSVLSFLRLGAGRMYPK